MFETCGHPVRCVEVKLEVIGRDAGNDVGEILVKSAMTMRGYWENPEATSKAFEDGWLRTDDIGSIDPKGYLSILDRKNDMIVTGGENVFPREVEDKLLEDPDVVGAAVFDLPDPAWVRKVVAAVILRAGAAPDEVAMLSHLKTGLAAYKCPKQIFFVDALPKNGAGKALRKTPHARFGKSS